MNRLYLIPDREEMELTGQLAADYGCSFEYNDFYTPSVLDDRRKQEEIIEGYARYRSDFSNDTMHGAFLDITVHSSDPLIRDASILRIRQSMDIAKRMGLRGVVFHTGRIAGFRTPFYLDQWLRMNRSFFEELAAAYPRQQIYMENMFDEAPDILAGLAAQMKDTEGFGVCLDYAHAALTAAPQQEWVETLAPYIRHMHINDNDLKNDLHQPVGCGSIDWQQFDRLLRRSRTDATVLVEVKGYEAQKASLEYMKQYRLYPMDIN